MAAISSSPYKALLVDLDGTLARPFLYVSPQVTEAVKRANEVLAVTIVSSREHEVVGEIANGLGLKALQISEGGARIFDPVTQESPWFFTLASDDAQLIMSFLERNQLPFSAVAGRESIETMRDVTDWRISRISATKLAQPQAEDIARRFGAMGGVHTTVIVRIDNGDWMVDFTHTEATKATAVRRFAELNGIETSQIIAAGDSYNDIPLLEACGLRIAMGNAVPELKALADYVAPSVDEDGLATAIDDFVLPRL